MGYEIDKCIIYDYGYTSMPFFETFSMKFKTEKVLKNKIAYNSRYNYTIRAGRGKIELDRPLTIMLKLLLYTCQ